MNNKICDESISLRSSKDIAKITICSGFTIVINDSMQFKVPTKEQIKNLKETSCIDAELINNSKN